MFNKEVQKVKVLKPMIEEINAVLAPMLVKAFDEGYALGRKNP